MSNLDVLIQESSASINYDALPTVTGDFVRLSQVFQNILGERHQVSQRAAPVIDITTTQRKWGVGYRRA